MSRSINAQAWDILGEDEKTALSLQLGYDKSSWESGEIMGKSHYKYLEIKYRAEQFLKIFTEHFELFTELIPTYMSGDKVALDYLRVCISKRVKPVDAIREIYPTHGKIIKQGLHQKIIKTVTDWEKNERGDELAIFNLVKEFDRWNNFRILPKEIQEPSAFKRRVKNTYKKQIRHTCAIHPIAISKIMELHGAKKSPYLYLPVICEDGPSILKLRDNTNTIKTINTLSIYIFKKEEDAKQYVDKLWAYLSKDKKECTDGLEFWPQYRETIKLATNYHTVLQITPTRKYLQYAMEKLNFI